jgi:acetylornithine deacetylase/succinyl-diaminopimelate desuccinylase-like protein
MSSVFTDIWEEQALDLFKSLIRINTSNPPGNELEAAQYIRMKLEEKGIGSICFEPEPGRANVIAKLGSGSKTPVILLSHLDVVTADPSKWSHPPFEAHEEDGVIYGRGTLDTKQLTAMQLSGFLLLKDVETLLDRTVYFVASADEEAGSKLGMEAVIREYPELQQESFVISEGGGFPLLLNGRNMILCAAGEKGVCRIVLRAEGSSGHASCPPEQQAVYRLSEALDRLASYKFPKKYTPLSRNFILETGLSPDSKRIVESTYNNLMQYMLYDGLMINEVRVGQRINVIPSTAEAEIEFRVLPGTNLGEIKRMMKRLMREQEVQWEVISFEEGYESVINSELLSLFEENCLAFGLDAKLVPFLALGRTDGRFLGPYSNSIHGFSPTKLEDHFAAVLERVHQHDERISRDSYLFGAKVISQTLLDFCVN